MTDRINRPVPSSMDELAAYSKQKMEEQGPRNWILDESGNVVPCSFMEWVMWHEHSNQRRIRQEHIGDYYVSTLFEGIDHFDWQWFFETMAFGPEEEVDFFGKPRMLRKTLWAKRTVTLKEALEAHQEGIEFVKQHLEKLKQHEREL